MHKKDARANDQRRLMLVAGGAGDDALLDQDAIANDAAALRGFRLTVTKVRRFAVASERLHALTSRDPNACAQLSAARNSNATGWESTVALFEAMPRVRAEIEAADLSVFQYVMTLACLTAASFHQWFDELGQTAELEGWLSPENLRVFEAHRSEIRTILQHLQALQTTTVETPRPPDPL